MSKMFGRKNITAILSIAAIGAALSFGVTKAVAGDDVTESQILKALTPEKKPLTRGLSVGPPADPAAVGGGGKLVEGIRGRATRSFTNPGGEENANFSKRKRN